MRYCEITEADAAAQADAQRAQRDKLQAANDKIAKASQTYQTSLRNAHDSATAAKKKLATPSKPRNDANHYNITIDKAARGTCAGWLAAVLHLGKAS